MPFPINQRPEERENDDSEEEQQREQRLQRTYQPANTESRLPQDEEERSNSHPQANFLTWNPNHRFMVLQINDFIEGRSKDSGESEENEKIEETTLTKPGQHFPYQGTYDFENSGAIPPPSFQEEMPRSYKNVSKKKKNSANFSIEDTESDVYGTDPVVHFLRSRNKSNVEPFDFGELPAEDEDEFGNWWKQGSTTW